MKRFHVFKGQRHYPQGGSGDYGGSFSERGEAIAAAQEGRPDWAEVLESAPDGSLRLVWSLGQGA